MVKYILVLMYFTGSMANRIFSQTAEYTQWKCNRPWDKTMFCASNGLEYQDPWQFICDQRHRRLEKWDLFLINHGPCNKKLCPRGTGDFSPVCGSDGNIYYNADEIKCISVIKPGLIEMSDSFCGLAEDGNDTSDTTEHTDEQTNDDSDESIDKTDNQKENENYTLEDSKSGTKKNETTLNMNDKSRSGDKLRQGGCSQTDAAASSHLNTSHTIPPCSTCTNQWNPVCGSDGTTYINNCQLDCNRRFYPDLHLAYNGSCQKAGCGCSNVPRSVCGTNGVTYINRCFFDCERKQDVELAHHGACKPGDCLCPLSDMKNPVCGSDGVTYLSVCRFKCRQSKTPDLTIVSTGYCSLTAGGLTVRSRLTRLNETESSPEQ